MGKSIWKFENTGRWIRGRRNYQRIVNSKHANFMIESQREQDNNFPLAEVRFDLLEGSDYKEETGHRGTRRFWHLHLADELIDNAALIYDKKN